MKQFLKIIFCHLFVIQCYGQSFQNGDLDGVVNGLMCLPDNWQKVPFDDPICLATQLPYDTPDLTNLSGPSVADGINGNPFSGLTFVSGAIGNVINTTSFFQEGIMQAVNNFTISSIYRINFRQATVQYNGALDKSGSWAVYVDTVLADISEPSYSNEPYNSINIHWEVRSVTFTATATSHLIKFLPMDDDSNLVFSNTDTTGALYMGIDSIGLEIVTGTDEFSNKNDFQLFPNPNKGSFKLQYNGNLNKTTTLYITDVYGKFIDTKEFVNTTTDYENTSLLAGLYFYSLQQGNEEVGRGKFVVGK